MDIFTQFPDRRVGIIAGSGLYPRLLCQKFCELGITVVAAGLMGQAAGQHFQNCKDFEIFAVGKINSISAYFVKHGVSRTIMAGGIKRKGLLKNLKPDAAGAALLLHGLKGDDDFLRLAAASFDRRNIEIIDPRPVIADWFAGSGILAGPLLSDELDREINVAFDLARKFTKTGKGQSLSFYQGKQWGREDRMGTDVLIAGTPGPGAILVKLSKPGQDMRFDAPVIGPSTVLLAGRVGMRAIVIETGGVMILKREKVFELCDRLNITLIGKS